MTPDQIPQLIAEIALADPRLMRDTEYEQRSQAAMWGGILADVPYDFAIRAARQHYAESQWPLLPANVAARWRTTVRDRMERHTDPTPDADPDDVAAYQSELRATRRAVASGEEQPRAISSGEIEQDDVAAMRQQGDLQTFLRQELAAGKARNKERRALVLRYPDLAKRLTEPPISHTTPGHWSGYVGPDIHNGAPNDSPIRAALAALVTEAEQRDAAERKAA